jgi:hypothetical protein
MKKRGITVSRMQCFCCLRRDAWGLLLGTRTMKREIWSERSGSVDECKRGEECVIFWGVMVDIMYVYYSRSKDQVITIILGERAFDLFRVRALMQHFILGLRARNLEHIPSQAPALLRYSQTMCCRVQSTIPPCASIATAVTVAAIRSGDARPCP